jgi:CRP-like cAMP-binding protein
MASTASVEQLSRIHIFSSLHPQELVPMQPYSWVQSYLQDEVIMHEGDVLPQRLYAVLTGSIRVTRTGTTGKETILRTLTAGEIFAAPALLGDGMAPATVTAKVDCQVLMVGRDALLNAIQATPEIALRMLSVFNQRLQQLHDNVHGLISERAIARLARYIQQAANHHGTETTLQGNSLRSPLPYYQIARSIGITYEECVRLFKQLQSVVDYRRGGKITVLDWQKLESIAAGIEDGT